MATKLAPIQIVRRITLGVILVGLSVVTYLHQHFQGIPSIDALCPFGGLETLSKFIAGGELIKKIEPGTIVLFGGIVALGLVLARFFCGWFCAFGALQGVFGWLGKKLFGDKRPVMPAKLDRYLRWIKYPILVVIIYFTWKTGTLVIRPNDPWAAYGHLSAGLTAVWAEFAVGFVLLIVSLALSLFYDRAFCKYICPLGAVNAILGRVPLFRIKREASSCISCSKCDKVCPMNIDVSTPAAVNSPECIACMECVTACPTKPNSLKTSIAGKAIKLGLIVGLGFAIYAGTVLIGKAMGYAAKPLSQLAAEGKLNVADIKGSSTWEMVAQSFGVELEMLYREVGVDMSKVPPTNMLKETGKVENYADFEVDSVRVAVARILGIEYVSAEGAMEPQKAEPSVSAAPANSPLSVPADFILEGTMSIDQIAAALTASPDAIISKLKLPADISRSTPLRDMKDQYGYNMPDLKARIKE